MMFDYLCVGRKSVIEEVQTFILKRIFHGLVDFKDSIIAPTDWNVSVSRLNFSTQFDIAVNCSELTGCVQSRGRFPDTLYDPLSTGTFYNLR